MINKLKSLIGRANAKSSRSTFKNFKGESGLRQPHSADEFQQILQQERRAADQTGREFCLLVFEWNGGSPSDALVQNLWQVIHQRVRRTDKVGWLSSQSLGVILPETPFADSRKVAEEVCRILEAATPLVSYKILTYPRRSL